MKIAIINNIYPPFERGGAEQVVVKTAEGLRDAGHDVLVITSTPEADNSSRENGITVYRIHPRNIYFYTDGGRHGRVARVLWHIIDIFNMSTARKVSRILRAEKPDIVHTHNIMGLSFQIPAVIRSLGLRHAHTVHDVQLVEPSAMILKAQEKSLRYTGAPTRVYTWLMKRLVGSPDVVISPSQFLLDFYNLRGFFSGSHCTVLRNPSTFDAAQERPAVARAAKFRFLYVGQIEYHKGVALLVETFLRAQKNTDFKAELNIVGSGSALAAIEKLAEGSDCIAVHGRKPRAELPALFAATDVTVVPSLCYENSPTVIFESLHFGVPVLASDIEGIAELIREGENGLTFVAGDSASLEDKMLWCMDHRAEVERMAEKTKKTSPGLSGDTYIERLVSLYAGEL